MVDGEKMDMASSVNWEDRNQSSFHLALSSSLYSYTVISVVVEPWRCSFCQRGRSRPLLATPNSTDLCVATSAASSCIADSLTFDRSALSVSEKSTDQLWTHSLCPRPAMRRQPSAPGVPSGHAGADQSVIPNLSLRCSMSLN